MPATPIPPSIAVPSQIGAEAAHPCLGLNSPREHPCAPRSGSAPHSVVLFQPSIKAWHVFSSSLHFIITLSSVPRLPSLSKPSLLRLDSNKFTVAASQGGGYPSDSPEAAGISRPSLPSKMKALLPAAFLEAIFFSSRAAAIFPVTYKVDSISPSISYDPPLCGEESTTVDGKRFCAPNQARNAWNSSFLNTVQRPHELDTDVFPSCTWATYQDGMSAPTASLSFVGRYVAVVGSSSCSKSDTAHGLIELEVDAKVVDKCVADGGRTVRCGHAVAYGRHTFTVRLVSGSFAIDRFEVSTGNKEYAAH